MTAVLWGRSSHNPSTHRANCPNDKHASGLEELHSRDVQFRVRTLNTAFFETLSSKSICTTEASVDDTHTHTSIAPNVEGLSGIAPKWFVKTKSDLGFD